MLKTSNRISVELHLATQLSLPNELSPRLSGFTNSHRLVESSQSSAAMMFERLFGATIALCTESEPSLLMCLPFTTEHVFLNYRSIPKKRSNNTINPAVCVGLDADFIRTLAHRGLW